MYWYSCYGDLNAIAEGYDVRKRDEWQRHLLVVQALTGESLTYDDLFSSAEKSHIKNKEDWEAFKNKFSRSQTKPTE